MPTTRQAIDWSPIALAALVLLLVVLSAGYGLIGIFLILILLSMAGGALLYWVGGESDE